MLRVGFLFEQLILLPVGYYASHCCCNKQNQMTRAHIIENRQSVIVSAVSRLQNTGCEYAISRS
jgi:hypothetical protein